MKSGLFNHPPQLLSSDDMVYVPYAIVVKFRSFCLEFFGRAGHDRDNDYILPFHTGLRREDFL